MRTVIAPLGAAIDSDLAALGEKQRSVAWGYVRRLQLEPALGFRLVSGPLATAGGRAVHFDELSRPEALGSGRLGLVSTASGAQSCRLIYRLAELPALGVRLVHVLAVGEAGRGGATPYRTATERLVTAMRTSTERSQ